MRHNIKKSCIATLMATGTFLSLVIVPAATYAATNSATTTVTAALGSTISISSGSTVNFSITPVSGGAQTSASDTVSVSTNNAAGYTLTIADSDATTTLVSGANTIAASSNTYSSPTTLANNTWGYAVPGGNFDASYTPALSNAGSSSSKWAGMPASSSPQTIKTTATTASNDSTTIWYSAKADTTKPNGNYADTVTYTASTN